MEIKPKIKNNIALNAHPLGCKQNILNSIDEIKALPNFGKKKYNVLIIGGSSGYGLASRIVMAFNNGAFTYNVSLESGPSKRNTGSAGFYNNYHFKKIASDHQSVAYDLNADCFDHLTKLEVVEDFKRNDLKIDLIIYSVASGIRIDPDTKTKYVSAIKPIDQTFNGIDIDIVKKTFKQKSIEPASESEIESTIKVMGGDDFLLWMKTLDQAGILNDGVKAVAYTYIGSPCTYDIYKNGTIGQAKRDLETKNILINKLLEKYQGKSYIVSAKSVVTKASNFIPNVPVYISAVYKVLKKQRRHESITKHIYRLFADMIYGDKIILDEDGIIRLDAWELNETVQNEVLKLMNKVDEHNFMEVLDYQAFRDEFMQINGFNLANIDYQADVDMTPYLEK